MTNLCKSKNMEDILKIDDHNDKKMWQNKNVLGRGLVRFPWGDLTDNFAAILSLKRLLWHGDVGLSKNSQSGFLLNP